MLHCGEPIAEGNIHAGDETWKTKLMSRPNWWLIHPYSLFRRHWDVFLMVGRCSLLQLDPGLTALGSALETKM